MANWIDITIRTIVLLVTLVGAANAKPTTWTFAGVVNDGFSNAGRIVSGSITFDVSAIPVSNTDGVTTALGGAIYFPPYSSPPQVTGFATDGLLTANIGGGAALDTVTVIVKKGYQSPFGFYDNYFLQVSSSQSNDVSSYVVIQTLMPTDGVNSSGMFGNSNYENPDLSFDQSVNWFSAGAMSIGGFQTSAGVYESFVLTSVTVSAIPEPGTSLMLALGLIGFGFQRAVRQKLIWNQQKY